MTSVDTSDTQCSACLGGDRCYRARATGLANAYALGCRSPLAREANAEKARLRRARVRAEHSDGTSPGDWEDVIPERELTGETCSQCGEPYYWERARAGQSCANGHWANAPGTTERIPVRERASAPVADPQAEMMERMRISVRKQALTESCERLINGWLNPENYVPGTWQMQYAEQTRREFRAMLAEITRIDDAQQLNMVTLAWNAAIGIFQASYLSQLKAERERIAIANDGPPALPAARKVIPLPAGDEADEANEADEDEDDYSGENGLRRRYLEAQRGYRDDRTRYEIHSTSLPVSDPYTLMGIAIAKSVTAIRESRRSHSIHGPCVMHKKSFGMIPAASVWIRGYNSPYRYGANLGYQSSDALIINTCGSRKCNKAAIAELAQRGYQHYDSGELDISESR